MHPSRRFLTGAMLVVVAAWAVAAIVFLAATLSAADSIQGSVGTIQRSLSGANQDLDYVRLTHRTASLAKRIAAAARPLSTRLSEEIAATDGIRRRASSIEATTGRIAGTARSIDAKGGAIERHAGSIAATVAAIDATVNGIESDAGSVRASVNSTYRSVLAINGRFDAVEGAAHSIDTRVRGINVRAQRAVGLVAQIADRLNTILDAVGTSHGTPLDAPIRGHANSIDCRVRGSYCDH